jgi:hypothetical protein
VAISLVPNVTDGGHEDFCAFILGNEKADRHTSVTVRVRYFAPIHPAIAEAAGVDPFDKQHWVLCRVDSLDRGNLSSP